MSKKKPAMVITIECENKEEVKNVLNLFKDALAAHLPELTKDDFDEPEPEAFRPKEGDICTYLEDDEPTAIFLYNGKEHIDEDGIRMLESELSLEYSGNLIQPYIAIRGEGQEVPADDCRLATEEEIKLFNEKTKSFKEEKDAEHSPEKAKHFWIAKFAFYAGGIFEPTPIPSSMWASPVYADEKEAGWIFRTEEECQQLCDKLNEAIKNVKP